MRCLGALLVLALLAGCTPADYPADWPRPASSSMFTRKGGCPDLSGDYDQVRSELAWLLGTNPDYEKAAPAWQEHRAKLDLAPDGSTLNIEMSLNERGLAEFRERTLQYNQEHVGGPRWLRLRRGHDYTCSGGWLHSLHFPQLTKAHGAQRIDLRMARDRQGGLIAGARRRLDQSFGWGDSRGVPLWSRDETRWHRWPARPAAADVALSAAQSVSFNRHDWVNHGRSVPTRFTSFHVEPICVRYTQYGRTTAPHGPELRRGRDDTHPPAPECPADWGKFDVGEVFRTAMDLPGDTPLEYRLTWFPLARGEAATQEIVVRDPRSLPLMPKD